MDQRSPQGTDRTALGLGQRDAVRSSLLLFARNFVKHPRMLGSVIPSSRYLIRQVLRHVDWARSDLIVEYGPGVGTFTREILARLKPQGRLVVIETNQEFVRHLRATVKDPRLDVVEGSAAEVEQILARLRLGRADYIISGIPFSTLPATLRRDILDSTKRALRPGGEFLVYQFSSSVLDDLRRVFGTVQRGFEPRNVLPAHWFRCQAPAAVAELYAVSKKS